MVPSEECSRQGARVFKGAALGAPHCVRGEMAVGTACFLEEASLPSRRWG